MLKILVKLIFIFLVTLPTFGQDDKSYSSPVDIPIKLSGTFGELRSDHFHSGIDIKTGEREGHNINAIDTGYISRIKIQSGGYGKALYITHPDGKTTVYGHLQKFNSHINTYVISEQYRQESYEIDLYPYPGQFFVSAGELVAYSGNSGRSGGPHLHFEIRDSNQKPMNPILFGFNVSDQNSPVINYLKVYPAEATSTINNKRDSQGFYTILQNSVYQLNNTDTIMIGGPAYFGINTIDLFNGGINKNGVYSIQLSCNDKTIYSHSLFKFDFNETRYINALIDYKEYKTLGRKIQYAYVQPNNSLSIYENVENRGIINFEAGQTYQIEFKVSDAAGNKSILSFVVQGVNPSKQIKKKKSSDPLFDYRKTNTFATDAIRIEVPGKALYDTVHFHYEQLAAPSGTYSALHSLHYHYVPLQTWCSLSILANNLPKALRDKVIIASLDEDNEWVSEGGKWENGYVTTQIRSFGKYCILADTIAPIIKAVNIEEGKSLLAQSTIKIKITDDLSGIKKYEGRLNGNWILMAYDEKNDLLIYDFDHLLKSGENLFELKVWDQVGNVEVHKIGLVY